MPCKFKMGDSVVIVRHDRYPKAVGLDGTVIGVHPPMVSSRSSLCSYDIKMGDPSVVPQPLTYVRESWLKEVEAD